MYKTTMQASSRHRDDAIMEEDDEETVESSIKGQDDSQFQVGDTDEERSWRVL